MSIRGLLLVLLAAAVILGGRASAPSDIWEKDQPRTIAYTIDIIQNGNWMLPRDNQQHFATKPPLYNWLDVPVIWAFGPQEWAFKVPSILAGLGIAAMVFFFTRWMLRSDESLSRDGPNPVSAEQVGYLASIAWLANYAISQHIYRSRPDMLMYAAVTAAWILGTMLLQEQTPRRTLKAIGFWTCIAAAALTKGLPALLPIAYIIVGAKLLQGKWAAVSRTRWYWGLPLTVLLIAGWIVPTYLIEPGYFKQVFVDQELERVVESGPMSTILSFYKTPGYFLSRFAPWSVLAVIALIHIRPRKWFSHPLAPAVLWVLLTILFFLFVSNNKPRYVAPAYGAAAALAAYGLLVSIKWRWLTPHRAMVGGVVVALLVGIYWHTLSRAAVLGYGDNVKIFAREVKLIVGNDPIAFDIEKVEIPIQSLLGVNQLPDPSDEELANAKWLIATNQMAYQGHVAAESKPVWPACSSCDGEYRLILYNLAPENPNEKIPEP